MNAADIAKYAALLMQVLELEKRFREDPPDDVEEYAALAAEIAGLYKQIEAIVKEGRATPADIKAAHASNQREMQRPAPPDAEPE